MDKLTSCLVIIIILEQKTHKTVSKSVGQIDRKYKDKDFQLHNKKSAAIMYKLLKYCSHSDCELLDHSIIFASFYTQLVWPHQLENPPGRPRAQQISPHRSPS